MTSEPKIGRYLDEEERLLAEAIESDDYEPGPSLLTPELKAKYQAAAKNTLDALEKERVKISLRVRRGDLERLKAKAAAEGMPYQTLINSILHKAVS